MVVVDAYIRSQMETSTDFNSGPLVYCRVTGLFKRAKQVYSERGPRILLFRAAEQIEYQFSERVFGCRAWLRIRAFANGLRYEMVPEPYEIEYADPADVRYLSTRHGRTNHSRWKDVGRVVDGDWDLESKSPEYAIENELLYQAISDHFERNVPWEETEYVEKSLERLRQDGHEDTWRAVIRSEEDLWERCEQLNELYERIERGGYKSKREVFASQSSDPMGYYPQTYKYTLDEVMVDYARDGEPLLVDGKHRLFIAKVCKVEEIPVLVVVRHEELPTTTP